MLHQMKYVRNVFSLPYGRLVFGGQALLFALLLCWFIKVVPWLMAYDIAEIDRYDTPKPPPHSARAFSVSHGTFQYYDEFRTDAPLKFWGNIVGVIGLSCILTVWGKATSKQIENELEKEKL